MPKILSLIALFLASCVACFADDAKVYYPAQAPATVVSPAASSSPLVTSVLYLIFLGVMAWAAYLLWRRKNAPVGTTATPAAIQISATRPLGNRQFLVVAHYKDQELLLGVGEGFITRLDTPGCQPSTKGEASVCQK